MLSAATTLTLTRVEENANLVCQIRPSKQHFPVLDGLRGIAVLGVVLTHYTISNSGPPFGNGPLEFGWAGVDLFFVLYGFLITGILLDQKESPNYFRNFYARRVLRIFPLYYGILALGFSLKALHLRPVLSFDHCSAFWYLFFAYNLFISAERRFPQGTLCPVWSLAIEEQFYFFWPYLISKFTRQQLVWTCATLMALALGLRICFYFEGASIANYYFTFTRADTLAAGAIVAILFRSSFTRRNLNFWSKVTFLGSVLILVLVMVKEGGVDWLQPLLNTIGLTIVALMFASLVLMSLTTESASRWQRLLESGLLRTFGRYSYAIYLFHFPMLACLSHPVVRILREAIKYPWPVFLIGYSVISGVALVAAMISYRYFESFFLRQKIRFQQI